MVDCLEVFTNWEVAEPQTRAILKNLDGGQEYVPPRIHILKPPSMENDDDDLGIKHLEKRASPLHAQHTLTSHDFPTFTAPKPNHERLSDQYVR